MYIITLKIKMYLKARAILGGNYWVDFLIINIRAGLMTS